MRSIRDLLKKWADIPINNLSVYYIPKDDDETNVHSSYEFPKGTFILRRYEKPHDFSWEFKRKLSMLEKLTEHYKWAQELGIEGHAVGFCVERKEVIQPSYEFPKGSFTLRLRTIDEERDFCLWDCGANQ